MSAQTLEAPSQPTKFNAVQAVNRLRQLNTQAFELEEKSGANLYERVYLCYRLTEDRDWLADHQFDEAKAIEHLDRHYLCNLHGVISLNKLLAIYRWQPEKDWWAEHRYNLKIIDRHYENYLYEKRRAEQEASGIEPPPPREPRMIPVAVLKEKTSKLVDEVKHYRCFTTNLQKDCDRKAALIGNQSKKIERFVTREKELEAQVARLDKELSAARRHIEELEIRLGLRRAG